jgi:hypothetical protein
MVKTARKYNKKTKNALKKTMQKRKNLSKNQKRNKRRSMKNKKRTRKMRGGSSFFGPGTGASMEASLLERNLSAPVTHNEYLAAAEYLRSKRIIHCTAEELRILFSNNRQAQEVLSQRYSRKIDIAQQRLVQAQGVQEIIYGARPQLVPEALFLTTPTTAPVEAEDGMMVYDENSPIDQILLTLFGKTYRVNLLNHYKELIVNIIKKQTYNKSDAIDKTYQLLDKLHQENKLNVRPVKGDNRVSTLMVELEEMINEINNSTEDKCVVIILPDGSQRVIRVTKEQISRFGTLMNIFAITYFTEQRIRVIIRDLSGHITQNIQQASTAASETARIQQVTISDAFANPIPTLFNIANIVLNSVKNTYTGSVKKIISALDAISNIRVENYEALTMETQYNRMSEEELYDMIEQNNLKILDCINEANIIALINQTTPKQRTSELRKSVSNPERRRGSSTTLTPEKSREHKRIEQNKRQKAKREAQLSSRRHGKKPPASAAADDVVLDPNAVSTTAADVYSGYPSDASTVGYGPQSQDPFDEFNLD